MDTRIQEFCSIYKKKLNNDKDIAEKPLEFLSDYRDRIIFYVSYNTHSPASPGSLFNLNTSIMRLDEEDLKYLYDKYSKKLKEEMDKNINELKDKYNL